MSASAPRSSARAARAGGEMSIRGIVRQIVRRMRKKADRRAKPSEVFERFFGKRHGVELPPRQRYGYRPVEFADDDSA